MTSSRKALFAGALTLALLLAQTSLAEQTQLGAPESNIKRASMKMWRGIVNTATGIGELIRQPIVCTKEDGAVGVPVGLINGVIMSVVRTSAGILEVFTFPWALDDTTGYDSLLNPDYVWQQAEQ